MVRTGDTSGRYPMPEPIPGKLYVCKWGERGFYQTKHLIRDTSPVYYSLKKGDIFLLLEHSVNEVGNFRDVVLKVLVGETCGWILFDRIYANRPNSLDLMEEYTESSS